MEVLTLKGEGKKQYNNKSLTVEGRHLLAPVQQTCYSARMKKVSMLGNLVLYSMEPANFYFTNYSQHAGSSSPY